MIHHQRHFGSDLLLKQGLPSEACSNPGGSIHAALMALDMDLETYIKTTSTAASPSDCDLDSYAASKRSPAQLEVNLESKFRKYMADAAFPKPKRAKEDVAAAFQEYMQDVASIQKKARISSAMSSSRARGAQTNAAH